MELAMNQSANHRFVYIYGFDKMRNLVCVKFLMDGAITIGGIKRVYQNMLKDDHSAVLADIYAVDNSKELRESYWEICKTNDFAKKFEFWDYVKTKGFELYRA